MRTSKVQLLLVSVAGCLAQLAARPASSHEKSSLPLQNRLTNTTSANVSPYQTDTSLYYLGYRGDDWDRPFAKYWNPDLPSISDELQKGLTESPFASPLAFSPQQAGDFLTRPGYLQLENGWTISGNGTLMLAARTDMGSGEMYSWWFGWHLTDSQRYKLWHPLAHQYAWRYPNIVDWKNKTLPERYIGSYSFINEYIGNYASKLTVNFIDPTILGFNPASFESQGIEAVIVGHITTGHVTNITGNSYLIHQIRRKPDGERELRSRFLLDHFTEDQAHGLGVHCGVEMSHLATFLPRLYSEFKDAV
ncbi:phloretin hydrolase [Paramyrothecium foliicola]|nr:phloretin hydrolase [Paramyrothecium foliicola]